MSASIETRSGLAFYPLAPRVEDIRVEDIAHALSQQCRFSGHTKSHYSVAEHSVRVSFLLEDWAFNEQIQLWGLLHDASEAYLVDLPAPLKVQPEFAAYREAEKRLMRAVCERFGLPVEEPLEVRMADGVLLATEARDLMAYVHEYWDKLCHSPLPEPIVPWFPETARHNFLARYRALTEHDTERAAS